MSSIFYLPRKLSSKDGIHTEDELLAASNYVVVLAEPGGGKTELMGSLARKLGISTVTANKFKHLGSDEENSPLVIDAFDELAKLDQTGIHSLLANARKSKPTHVIISSRSSEWDTAATNAFEDFLGYSPLVVRLVEFKEEEQRTIFNHHVHGENFATFQAEVARFDLGALLPNPQFLKMFADAYLESGRRFTDKRNIFSLAVERLAKEANASLTKANQTLSTTQKVDMSSEVFAKLLLSGAEGIGTSEATADQIYPLLASLFDKPTIADSILATRLFRPGDNADQHRPVHKIVTEYCAANYFSKRIANPADALTFSKLLPIIAPNSVVRDELRGLLGWLASLGNKDTQESAINLDPYAVLANGDPSQLDRSSKHLLVQRLKDVEKQDPYFRRGDFWRRFSAAGFFTADVMEEIKPLLRVMDDGHLKTLILELLRGSPAIEQLQSELLGITLDTNETENARLLACKCLLDVKGVDYLAVLNSLISLADEDSLRISKDIILSVGVGEFELSVFVGFLRAAAILYPTHDANLERKTGSRYFVKQLIEALDLSCVKLLLDNLSCGLACSCKKKAYACNCRNGTSKIIGSLLDRYFDLAVPPFEPENIWDWIKNLNFHEPKSADQSTSVQILGTNNILRWGIIAHVFYKLTDTSQIFETKIEKFDFYSHSGLYFQAIDYRFIIEFAFKINNPQLWLGFMAKHRGWSKLDRGPDSLRRRMREQASAKPSFMREWAKFNRAVKLSFREKRMPGIKQTRAINRRRKERDNVRAENAKYIQENKVVIESGKHFNSLMHFSKLVLEKPSKTQEEYGDEKVIKSALKNCLEFIDPKIPDLVGLAKLQCSSEILASEQILFASCILILRDAGSLEAVDIRLLEALRTNINMHYSAITSEDRTALKTEVDRLIFTDASSAEKFLRKYVEPQLSDFNCAHPDVWILHDDAFAHLCPSLSVEWLSRFPGLDIRPLETLFEVAVAHGDRIALQEIIEERCASLVSDWRVPSKKDLNQRTFWFVRAFYFLDDVPKISWDWLKVDKESIFLLSVRSVRLGYGGGITWPKLTLPKVVSILEAFIDKWPKTELPSSWGTGSPKEEIAYRFLVDLTWSINSYESDDVVSTLNHLIADPLYSDLHRTLKSIRAGKVRESALRDFEPPTPEETVKLLDHDAVVTVEGLRRLITQELSDFQKTINGGEFNSADRFYEKGERLDENRCTEIIAERLNLRLEPQGISITPEHQLKSANRSDFTATKLIGGKRKLLVTEVKGQWHKELFTAASAQLHERYSVHPDAEYQGVFLVIWFGSHEKVAGLKRHGIETAIQLKKRIEEKLPPVLAGLIDVFVLDVSKH